MASINRVVLVGNLTRDPELRTTAAGASVCRMRLACNTRWRSSDSGEYEEKPNFFDVSVFGASAEACARFLEKGRPIAVDGRLDWHEWESSEGEHRQAVAVIADSVQFLASRTAAAGEGKEAEELDGEPIPF
ncbi:MAG TPA: single-stranded DNA-binding protein [Solirubrobacteraceae bacterium]|nr:single-stranded DNA-binding protein [Solirubrobacteraceae bacterium]